MGAHFLEEFTRGQMPGNVGHFVGVEGDDVIVAVQLVEFVTAVADDHVDIGIVEGEIIAAGLDDGRIELDAVDGDGPEDTAVLLGNGAGGQADDGQVVDADRALVEVGGGEHDAPDGDPRHAPAVTVEGVIGLPFVEQEIVAVAVAHDLDVVVGGFGFEDLSFVGFDAALGPEPDEGQQDQGQQQGDETSAPAAAPQAKETDEQAAGRQRERPWRANRREG